RRCPFRLGRQRTFAEVPLIQIDSLNGLSALRNSLPQAPEGSRDGPESLHWESSAEPVGRSFAGPVPGAGGKAITAVSAASPVTILRSTRTELNPAQRCATFYEPAR